MSLTPTAARPILTLLAFLGVKFSIRSCQTQVRIRKKSKIFGDVRLYPFHTWVPKAPRGVDHHGERITWGALLSLQSWWYREQAERPLWSLDQRSTTSCTRMKLVPAKTAPLWLGFVPMKVPNYPLRTCMWPMGMSKVMGCIPWHCLLSRFFIPPGLEQCCADIKQI